MKKNSGSQCRIWKRDLNGYLLHGTGKVTFRVPGKGKVAGNYTRDEFFTPFISRVMELSGGTFGKL